MTDKLISAGSVDADVMGEYLISYSATDLLGNEANKVIRIIKIDDSNFDRRPRNVRALSILGIDENKPVGTIVAELNATNPDRGEISYSLVSGEGDAGNRSFRVSSSGVIKSRAVFDYEKTPEYSIRIRATVPTGEYVEEIFKISVWDVVAPIVETTIPEVRDDGLLWIGGEIIDSEGANNWETGLLLSYDTPIVDPAQEGVIRIPRANNATEFEVGFFPGEDTKRVYAIAFAENSEGTHYGMLEKFDNTANAGLDNRNRGDIWTGAEKMEDAPGWWNSWWFGYYFKAENGWWYQSDLGWIFPSGGVGGGLWLWKEGLNWVWTKENVYPFLYSSETESWYYFYGGLNQNRMLFDYAKDAWRYLDDTEVDESKAEELVK